MVGCLDLSPLAGTDGNWTDHLLAEVLGFFWRGCHIRGLPGYRSLARLWAAELVFVPVEMSAVSAEGFPIFCPHVIGLYICQLFYFCFEPCQSGSCHLVVALLCLVFHQWRELFGGLVIKESLLLFYPEHLISRCDCVRGLWWLWGELGSSTNMHWARLSWTALARCSTLPLGCFSSLEEKENNRLLML